MPSQNKEDSIEKEVGYCEKLVKIVEEMLVMPNLPTAKEKLNLLKETMEDTKVGYKTKDTSFFGYKTHIAMTPERKICVATVTSADVM